MSITTKSRSRMIYRAMAFSVVAIALSAAAGFLWLRTSLPGLSETIRIAGLERDVEIVHDRNAIPHIQAAFADDAYMALGYLHARDRLFQMDFMRRLGGRAIVGGYRQTDTRPG